MIVLYEKTETDFTHNGICILDGHIIAPAVTEELNGLFLLEFDYPSRASYADKIIPERLIKCPVPDMNDQIFRIAFVRKGLSGMTHFTAYHVFYDLVDNLIEDTFVVNKTGQGAVTQILNATQYQHAFTATSNISTVESARLIRVNPAEVLLNANMDNGFLARWGGEIIRDNFHIAMRTVRGSDNGVSIRDRKNLTGYTADVDVQSACTRIMPQGFDGLLLPEKYIDSPRINQYTKPKIRVIKYDSVKAAVGQYADAEDAVPLSEAYTLLRALAKKEFSENHIDLPKASYSVAFAPLAKTEEYKNFAALETVHIGDTVTVVHERDGFEINARVVGYKYDPLLDAYISVTLGNYAPKFTDIAKDIKRVETGIKQAAAEANYALQSANGKNTNFYGAATPTHPRPGDLWYKENGDKLELWVYETREGVTQWYPLLTDLTQEQMKAELAEAAAMVEEAKAKSEEALAAGEAAQTAGEEALAAGQAAQGTADQARTESQNALEKANQAFDNAVSALNEATDAGTKAETASTTAMNAYNKSVKSTAVSYAVSASGTTVPSSGWQASVPTVSAGQFLWTRTVLTLQDNSAVTSYGVSKQGTNGTKGDKGDKGDTGNTGSAGAKGADAPTITAVREQYYLSTSKTAQSGGSWSDTVPAWVNGRYYWTRVVATYSNGSLTHSTPVLANALNSSLVTAFEAKTAAESLQTTVTQHASVISLNASNLTTLTGRVSTAEATLTVQAGQIASKANQNTVDLLTGRVTAAETAIVQNADSFTLSLAKQSKAVNDLAGAGILQTPWQQGTLSNSTGAESNSTSYVRSGWFDVVSGKRYLLQTYEGASAYSKYSTAYLYYYREDKTFISYSSIGNSTTPFTAPANARYLRVRFTTTVAPGTIDCYLLPTETVGGYINLSKLTNMVKVQATTDTLLFTVTETKTLIGAPYKVSRWERGTLNTSTGEETASTSVLRSGYIDVKPTEKYIPQLADGTAVSMYFHWYSLTVPYAEFIPAAKQYAETLTAGAYTNDSIVSYLIGKEVEGLSITGSVGTNPYTSSGDYLIIYRFPLESKAVPAVIRWSGYKDSSNNVVLLYSNESWEELGVVTATSATVHEWALSEEQQAGITGGSMYLAFFSIKTGSYAGIYNSSTTPFLLNPMTDRLLKQLSYSSTSGIATVPANALKMRVRVSTTIDPDSYTGNVYPGTVRQDYSKGDTIYSAMLMQKDLINLRVSKNDVINQINISTEGILISGNKIRITGTTTIDNSVIQTAMIANAAITTAKIADLSVSTAKITDAAITNAKIANLDAAKINTGTLSAARIAAGSITSDKLTIANGFIKNAMIADATIQSAKIATLDAGKITTGTLSAARIGANSITADKLATNAIQVGLAGWTSSIRITPTKISWYSGSTLEGYIDSGGMNFYYGTRFIGTMGESVDASNNTRRGIATHLNGQGDYATWAYRTGTSGTYTRFLTLDPKGVVNGSAGIHFGAHLRTNGYNFYTSGNRGVYLTDNALSGGGTYPAWSSTNGKSKVTFGDTHLYFITNGTYYTCTNIVNRVGELISRVNSLISMLNKGWISTMKSTSNGGVSWTYYSSTGLSSMSTSL